MSNRMIPFFLLCETPLHVGCGSDVGIVDMPIQRERHTGWPKIEASGVKGSIRNSFENKYENDREKIIDVNIAFGYDESGLNEDVKERFEGNKQFAGALGFTDARILLFPVKSLKGIFTWITCPAVLNRFFIDLNLTDCKIPKFKIEEKIINPSSSCIVKKDELGCKVVLEEFTIQVDENEQCVKLGKWLSESILPLNEVYNDLKSKLQKNIIILSDDQFSEFVSLSTEVMTRTKIDNETGTVEGKALFTEEYLPSETIMYTFAIVSPIFGKVKENFGNIKNEKEVERFFKEGLNRVIQIGGNANLGKGITSTKILEVK